MIKMDRFLIRKSSGDDDSSPQKKPRLFGEDVEVVGSTSRKVTHDVASSPSRMLFAVSRNTHPRAI